MYLHLMKFLFSTSSSSASVDVTLSRSRNPLPKKRSRSVRTRATLQEIYLVCSSRYYANVPYLNYYYNSSRETQTTKHFLEPSVCVIETSRPFSNKNHHRDCYRHYAIRGRPRYDWWIG